MPSAAPGTTRPSAVMTAAFPRGSAGRLGSSWPRTAGPVVLLLLEVGLLTPFVEFANGPMAVVADARVCLGLLFALVVFLFLGGGTGPKVAPAPSGPTPGSAASCSWV